MSTEKCGLLQGYDYQPLHGCFPDMGDRAVFCSRKAWTAAMSAAL
jgi:hypothetical protein